MHFVLKPPQNCPLEGLRLAKMQDLACFEKKDFCRLEALSLDVAINSTMDFFSPKEKPPTPLLGLREC
jgi:hypothetical protein